MLLGGQKTSEWSNKCLPPPSRPQPPFSWANNLASLTEMFLKVWQKKRNWFGFGIYLSNWQSPECLAFKNWNYHKSYAGPEGGCRFFLRQRVAIFFYCPSSKNAVRFQRQVMPNLICLMKGLVLPWDYKVGNFLFHLEFPSSSFCSSVS